VNALALAAALLSAALPVSQYRGTLDVADRTEMRAGNFGFPTDPAVHLETIPSAAVAVASRTSSATLSYAPHMGLSDLELGLNPYYLHDGTASLAQGWRHLRFSASESASYGTLNLSGPVLPAAGALSSRVLLTQQLLYEASNTVLAATLTERRWSWRLSLSYSINGAVHEQARQTFPLLQTPRAEFAADYTASRRTHLVTTLAAQHDSINPPQQDYSLLEANESLQHHLSRSTELVLTAGGAWVYALVAIPPLVTTGPTGVQLGPIPSAGTGTYVPGALRRSRTLYPTGEAALVIHAPYRDRVEGRLQARLGPAVNRTTGRLSQQVSSLATVRAIWHPWEFRVEGNFAQSLETGINYLTFFQVQSALGYEITRRVLIEAGTQFGWQKVGFSTTATTVELAFVAVTLHPRPLRF
jgi:hypothetical protein